MEDAGEDVTRHRDAGLRPFSTLLAAVVGGATLACAHGIPEPPPPVGGVPAPAIAADSQAAGPRAGPPADQRIRPTPLGQPKPPPLAVGSPAIEWSPARPIQGGAVAIHVRRPPGSGGPDELAVEVAGREVRLGMTADGWRGIAALPLDSAGVLEIEIRYRLGAMTDTRRLLLPVRERTYASSRLRVASRGEQRPEVQARIRGEREVIQATLRESEGEWLPAGPFGWPRPPDRTSPFGQRRTFNGVVQSRHLGLDLRGRTGAPVRAPAAGRVALVADDFFYQGNAVYLDHGLGLLTAYFHLSSVAVRQGDRVEAGQLLGAVGSTGRSTAPHLHWSAYVNGENVDPESLVGLSLDLMAAGPASRPSSEPR